MEYLAPIDYAKQACDMMIRKFKAEDLPPVGVFHYHQGVFLSGMYQTFLLCNEEKYMQYIKAWFDSVLDEDGTRKKFLPHTMDDMQPGILLYPLLDYTGDEKYKKAVDKIIAEFEDYPRTAEGGLWHKMPHPHQMWLDGLYMGGPLCAEYGKRYNKPELLQLVVEQALLMQAKTRDEKTGLLYHAYDSLKKESWANPETGKSAEFWGRSIGWVPVALLDDLDFMDEKTPGFQDLCDMATNLLKAVCKYQSESGLWYQVIDKVGVPGNWAETSCGCLFVAALCKAVRKGLLSASYLENAKKGFYATIDTLTWKTNDIQIGNVCIGTGVGDYQHYCDRPTSVNDLHGVGAFLLMCAEMERCLRNG
ncbi:MAG: glycoside hydrolase family 88 protein [Defluviitaleaceae bacterium]|nr:glycoside hydrolase family 88 protein [Defluviitaleaceae bacterium]